MARNRAWHGMARQGGAWQGEEHGGAWHGTARHGKARNKARVGWSERGTLKKGNNMSEYFKGIPTKIDVEKLDQCHGVPSEGTIFTFDQLAESAGLLRDSHRFRTVLNAWRKQLFRDHNILLVSIGQGRLKASEPDERIDWASRKVHSGRRAIGRAIVVAYQTDQKRLTDDKQKTARDIVSMNESKMRLAAGVMPKN